MTTGSCSDTNTTTVLKAAWIIAVVIILSKLFGFVRDVVIASYYGASTVSDAYFYAYQIPALALVLLGGVGGPFHSATVAVFSKIIPSFSEKPNDEIQKIFNTFLTSSFVVFTFLAILLFLFSDEFMKFIISGNNYELIKLASLHLKIMSPMLVIGGVIGILYGVLISYNEFVLPNLAPLVGSCITVGMIILCSKGDTTGVALAWATTIGSLAMLLLQVPKMIKIGFRVKPNLQVWDNCHFKMLCELLFPAILSSTVGQINIYVDMFFASSLKEGAWTAITYANRVFQFPVGVLVTAFLVPLFPLFSKLVAKEDFEGIKQYFNKGVGVLFFVSFPIIIGILVLGQDAVKILFERGAFSSDATFMVAQALWFLSFSILPYVFRDSITRVYYSFNDSATPFVVAFSSILLKVFLNILLVKKLAMGIGGITLSTSLVTLFNATILGILISKKLKLNYKSLFTNFFKMVVAALITGFVCYGLMTFISSEFSAYAQILPKYVFEFIKIIFIFSICIFLYSLLNLLFKMEYANELKQRLTERFKK